MFPVPILLLDFNCLRGGRPAVLAGIGHVVVAIAVGLALGFALSSFGNTR